MASDAADARSSRPLLTLGRVDRLRIQVGYRARPDGPAYLQFLLDLPVPEPDRVRDGFAEARVLAALEPVLYAGSGAPRHYSVHQHRWHTSWGVSPSAVDLGLLVTTGPATAAVVEAAHAGVTRAFRALLELAGQSEPAPTSREAAVRRARRSAAAAYALDPDALSLSSEEHHPAERSWTVGLRSTTGEKYDVVVGLVDGYAGSVRVRHEDRGEVSDSVGYE
ncbi:MAG: hypothetical protein ACXVXC_15055 [Nocardioidaceae bacterium]